MKKSKWRHTVKDVYFIVTERKKKENEIWLEINRKPETLKQKYVIPYLVIKYREKEI